MARHALHYIGFGACGNNCFPASGHSCGTVPGIRRRISRMSCVFDPRSGTGRYLPQAPPSLHPLFGRLYPGCPLPGCSVPGRHLVEHNRPGSHQRVEHTPARRRIAASSGERQCPVEPGGARGRAFQSLLLGEGMTGQSQVLARDSLRLELMVERACGDTVRGQRPCEPVQARRGLGGVGAERLFPDSAARTRSSAERRKRNQLTRIRIGE